MSDTKGTYACPICGLSTPHGHGSETTFVRLASDPLIAATILRKVACCELGTEVGLANAWQTVVRDLGLPPEVSEFRGVHVIQQRIAQMTKVVCDKVLGNEIDDIIAAASKLLDEQNAEMSDEERVESLVSAAYRNQDWRAPKLIEKDEFRQRIRATKDLIPESNAAEKCCGEYLSGNRRCPGCPDRPESNAGVREAIATVIAEIEMSREGTPYSRSQEEFYDDAYEMVDAIMALLPASIDVVGKAREALERAENAFEQIGITAQGCASTHGDPGGGLEMVASYASDGFEIARTALASLTGEGL